MNKQMTREEMKELVVRLRRDEGRGVMSIGRDYGISEKTTVQLLNEANPNWKEEWKAFGGGLRNAAEIQTAVLAYRKVWPNGGVTSIHCHPDCVADVRRRAIARHGEATA